MGLTADAINSPTAAPRAAIPRGPQPERPYEEVVPLRRKIERPLIQRARHRRPLRADLSRADVEAVDSGAGTTDCWCRQRVYRIGAHCQFSQPEMIKAFDDLTKWVRRGTRTEVTRCSGLEQRQDEVHRPRCGRRSGRVRIPPTKQ